MTNGNGKNPEDNIQAHFTYLLYKLMTSAKVTNDLSSGFDLDRGKRQQELSNNKKIKLKHHVRFILRDDFSSAEPQGKVTYGLGYKLTLTMNSNAAVLNKTEAIANAELLVNSIDWYVPHYTLSTERQVLISRNFHVRYLGNFGIEKNLFF